jgi:hypothetical protein
MTPDYDDFRNIDIQASLADCEALDMRPAGQLAERTIKRRSEVDDGLNLPWPRLHGHLTLRKRELVLLGGYTGHFKTTITSQIGAYAMREGHKVGVCSLELNAEDIIEQFAEISATVSRPAEGYVKRWCDWADDKLVIYDKLDSIQPHDAIRMAIKFAKPEKEENEGDGVGLGCRLIILDCLMMMGVCDDLEREREFVQTLKRVAAKFKVTIILVHHMKKPQGEKGEHDSPGKYQFNGSSHISNTPDTILVAWHDKRQAALRAKVEDMGVGDPKYDPKLRDMLLSTVKQRNGKYEGGISLWQVGRRTMDGWVSCRAFVDRADRKIQAFDPPANLKVVSDV